MDIHHLLNGEESKSKPNECHWCTKRFSRRSDLSRHNRIHTGEKPYPCNYPGCGKRFIQRSALTVHIRTHTGERPHKCEICTKTFSDSSSLARHRRTHSGQRPYVCNFPGCKKAFTRKTTLSRHEKMHNANAKSDVPSTMSPQLYSPTSPDSAYESEASSPGTPPGSFQTSVLPPLKTAFGGQESRSFARPHPYAYHPYPMYEPGTRCEHPPLSQPPVAYASRYHQRNHFGGSY